MNTFTAHRTMSSTGTTGPPTCKAQWVGAGRNAGDSCSFDGRVLRATTVTSCLGLTCYRVQVNRLVLEKEDEHFKVNDAPFLGFPPCFPHETHAGPLKECYC